MNQTGILVVILVRRRNSDEYLVFLNIFLRCWQNLEFIYSDVGVSSLYLIS